MVRDTLLAARADLVLRKMHLQLDRLLRSTLRHRLRQQRRRCKDFHQIHRRLRSHPMARDPFPLRQRILVPSSRPRLRPMLHVKKRPLETVPACQQDEPILAIDRAVHRAINRLDRCSSMSLSRRRLECAQYRLKLRCGRSKPAYQPITMFDSITFLERSRSAPVSRM